jgi:23S rRNA pseudouridine1911/1915/1917 synthase
MYEPRVVYESPAFLVLYKPPFMHTVPLEREREPRPTLKPAQAPTSTLTTGGETLLDWCVERFPDLGRVRGRKYGEGGILHRLDRETRGLVLTARTQEAFENLKRQQEEDRVVKSYGALLVPRTASLPGFPPLSPELEGALPSGTALCVESAFRAYGPGRKAVRPVTGYAACPSPAGKNRLYRTLILTAKEADGKKRSAPDGDTAGKEFIYAELSLTRGFRHQIRCHMAWLGFPIAGDPVYGGLACHGASEDGAAAGNAPGENNAPGRTPLALKAQGLSFFDPESGRSLSFSIPSILEE